MIIPNRVTVGTSATALMPAPLTPRARPVQQMRVHVPAGLASIYVGASNVTASTGYEVTAGGPDLILSIEGGDILYAVAAAPVVVHVLQTGV